MGKTSQCEIHHDAILAMNSQGIERQEIAHVLGLTKYAVQAYLQRRLIGMTRESRGKTPTISREKVRSLIAAGMTQSRVAEECGCSLSAIERICAKLGLQTARTGPRAGAQHRQRWSGGRIVEKGWYIAIYAPLHPFAKTTGYCLEHRLVLEVVLGRYLLPSEAVDHIDSHPQHNWPDNLRLYASNADHLKETLSGRYGDSRVRSLLGEMPSSRKTLQTPSQNDTLAQCQPEIRSALERHIQIHQPGPQHGHLPKKTLLRIGATHQPFQ